jgi:predicted adenylyl cyclase CyaB
MKEVEVKIYDIDEKTLTEKLQKVGAKLVKDVFLRTFYYESAFTKGKHIQVRIRYDVAGQQAKEGVLTVKGPRSIVRGLKVQDEHETRVDGATADAMLRTIGFKVEVVIEMKRSYYALNGCSVEICRMPRAKPFIEIEGSDRRIREAARLLGYSEKDFENTPIRKRLGISKNFKKWVF